MTAEIGPAFKLIKCEDAARIAAILTEYAARAEAQGRAEAESLLRLLAKHGDRGYRLGCRCDECRAAAWRRVKKQRDRVRAEGLDQADARHGTYAGHVAGCRCGPCVEARREYQKQWRERQTPAQPHSARRTCPCAACCAARAAKREHGKCWHFYRNEGCRCGPCVEFVRTSNVEAQQRRRARKAAAL